MRIIILLGFAFLSFAAFGQGDSLRQITIDFRLDSLGCNGLRKKHVTQDKITGVILLDRENYLGKTKEEVIGALGPPNSVYVNLSGRKRKRKEYEELNYFLTTCKVGSGISLLIIIESGVVISIDYLVQCG